jgi:molybdenum cofactor synthesis domain-containing protein
MPRRVAVLTVSDACFAGARVDRSGEAVVAWAAARGHAVTARTIVPDEKVEIVRQLLAWCDGDVADVVLTTGGTGLALRDVTPEATRAVIDRDAPGLAERIRGLELLRFPRAALSRAVAGTRDGTLIINLPGSPSGVEDALTALAPILEHAVDIVRGAPTDHSPGDAPRGREPKGGMAAG